VMGHIAAVPIAREVAPAHGEISTDDYDFIVDIIRRRRPFVHVLDCAQDPRQHQELPCEAARGAAR
jgi:hypothetical protein